MKKLLNMRITKVLFCVVLCLVPVLFYFSCMKEKPKENITEKTGTPSVGTNIRTTTDIQYLPKLGGVNQEKKSNSDVDVTIQKPKVKVSLNGEEHKFDLVEGETQKFEKGQLVLNQESEITFKIEKPKEHSLDVYAEVGYEINKGKHSLKVGVEKVNGDFSYGYSRDLSQGTHYVYARQKAKLNF